MLQYGMEETHMVSRREQTDLKQTKTLKRKRKILVKQTHQSHVVRWVYDNKD